MSTKPVNVEDYRILAQRRRGNGTTGKNSKNIARYVAPCDPCQWL
jgi:hypothetical protein